MAIRVLRGKSDTVIDRMIETLQEFQADHPKSQIDLYRQNSVSVRIRIVDPDFSGLTKADRSKATWKYLNSLPDEIQADLSALILLTPDETKKSAANIEFEDPIPSRL